MTDVRIDRHVLEMILATLERHAELLEETTSSDTRHAVELAKHEVELALLRGVSERVVKIETALQIEHERKALAVPAAKTSDIERFAKRAIDHGARAVVPVAAAMLADFFAHLAGFFRH